MALRQASAAQVREVDVAAGGVGKSSLKIGEAIAMASGKDFYAKGLPEGALTVWLWNLEDPLEEMERRIHATCERFNIKPEAYRRPALCR
jgi:RecA-family ATPase